MTGLASEWDTAKPSLEDEWNASPATQHKMADIPGIISKTAYGLGGAVTDAAAKVMSPEMAAGIGTVANVGVQAIPALLGGELAKTASPLLRSGAESLMQSALKPGIAMIKNGKAAKAISTMLDEGISVTPGGLTKLRNLISELNGEIMMKIRSSPASIDKNEVVKELLPTLARFKNQVNPTSDVEAIKAAGQEFLNHPLFSGPGGMGPPSNMLPVTEAQALKQGTYKVLGDKAFGELKTASTEAQKALAYGLKEGIAKVVPEIAGLNARESSLLTAMTPLERRVLIEGNKNPMGLSLLSGHPAAWAAFMADRSAAFKSVIARLLNAGKEQIPATVARTGIAGIEAANQNQQ